MIFSRKFSDTDRNWQNPANCAHYVNDFTKVYVTRWRVSVHSLSSMLGVIDQIPVGRARCELSFISRSRLLFLSEAWSKLPSNPCVPFFIVLARKESFLEGFGVEKVSNWLKKRVFIWEFFFFVFQPDECTVTCFIHFAMSHCSDNIRLMLPFFQSKWMVVWFFSWLFCFIYLFVLLVSIKYISKSDEISIEVL